MSAGNCILVYWLLLEKISLEQILLTGVTSLILSIISTKLILILVLICNLFV